MFEEKYFRSNPAYAKFKTAAAAQRSVERFYGGTFRLLARFLDAFVGKDVADVGCGYAGVLRHFRRKDNRCTGYDVSEYVVATNREVSNDINFVRCDIVATAPVLAAYDLVICMEVLEHIAESDRALINIRELLRPGGTLLM